MAPNLDERQHRTILRKIARRIMIERGLAPDFPPDVMTELAQIRGPAQGFDGVTRDLRNRIWCSIDNDDSRDLDQLNVAEALSGVAFKILVAIADVDAIVKKHSAIDDHAQKNTTSVYTAAQIFPMLPEKLSTDLTSLNFECDRLAIVVEMVFDAEGALQQSDIYRAIVRNHAKLAYNSVAAWLDGQGPMPSAIGAVDGLEANLRLQDHVAQLLKDARHESGALDLETIQTRPVFDGETIVGLVTDEQNRAKELIAEFMIAANGVSARFLELHQAPSIRRVVRRPKRWDRIVELASERGHKLPKEPDSQALEEFLVAAKNTDPVRFPDLSLSVIKLLGRGEYVAQVPGDNASGHFGLAVEDYAHSTAPNRRYPDLIAQRLLKAALSGAISPYDGDELAALATQCTKQEDAAKKVERHLRKSAAALLLQERVGDQFDAFVTGTNAEGVWVRVAHPPIEGRLQTRAPGLDVGHRLRVQLIQIDVELGFIDFKRVK